MPSESMNNLLTGFGGSLLVDGEELILTYFFPNSPNHLITVKSISKGFFQNIPLKERGPFLLY